MTMKTLKNLKNIALAGIASALFAFSSPASASPYDNDLYFNLRSSFTPRFYSLNLNESKKVPVHPGDASFLHGDTEVKAGSGMDYLVFDFGGEARYGDRHGWNIFCGADMEIDLESNGINYSNGRSDTGMFRSERQSSDTRPKSACAYVYDELEPQIFSLIPFAGVGYTGYDYFFDLEFGFANKDFKREWGHHRYDKEQAIGRENCSAKGGRLTFRGGPVPHDDLGISWQLMYEDYSLEKPSGGSAGSLKSYGAGVVFQKLF